MKKKTQARIIELAAEGLKPEAIKREVGCALSSVEKVINGIEPHETAMEPDQIIVRGKGTDLVALEENTTLQDVVSMLRGSYIRSAVNLTNFADRLGEVLSDVLQDDPSAIPPHQLQSFTMSYGIIM